MRDDEIDRLVRRAAEAPTDEVRLARRVQAQLRKAPPRPWGMLAPAGFAAVLAVIPFAIAGLPGPDALDMAIAALATGQPLVLMTDLPILGAFGGGLR